MLPEPTATPVLRIEHLSCERDDRVLFTDLSLALQAGQALRVVGPNGAGKTTLLRGVVGLNHYLDGQVSWVKRTDGHQPFIYIGHKTGVSPYLTVAENLFFLARLSGVTLIETQIDAALQAVSLLGYDDSLGSELSAGQQRRVALAQLYVPDMPACWVLDEPFAALDKTGVAELEQHMQRHCERGGSLLFTTHHEPQHLHFTEIHLVGERR
ncbi:cytochrome c biogenesis heme-transporting ATPase CcmA [Salinispirillum sp. LH 10-3-1]|uniref:Cytochrome c biogenesis heme-transporting ATPase CcmA n=1 Tax=Salinispirillum sp. LH 10-3-1 TaxID=2952525 RepID=A0AB38YDL6_9GAMM